MIVQSSYHSVLRVSALVCTCTLLFVSGVIHPYSIVLTENTEQYLANVVGASASVAPTELNQITAALTEQQMRLTEREKALTERELAIGLQVDNQGTLLSAEMLTWLNSVLLFVILVLLTINYILDFRHRQQIIPATIAVHNT